MTDMNPIDEGTSQPPEAGDGPAFDEPTGSSGQPALAAQDTSTAADTSALQDAREKPRPSSGTAASSPRTAASAVPADVRTSPPASRGSTAPHNPVEELDDVDDPFRDVSPSCTPSSVGPNGSSVMQRPAGQEPGPTPATPPMAAPGPQPEPDLVLEPDSLPQPEAEPTLAPEPCQDPEADPPLESLERPDGLPAPAGDEAAQEEGKPAAQMPSVSEPGAGPKVQDLTATSAEEPAAEPLLLPGPQDDVLSEVEAASDAHGGEQELIAEELIAEELITEELIPENAAPGAAGKAEEVEEAKEAEAAAAAGAGANKGSDPDEADGNEDGKEEQAKPAAGEAAGKGTEPHEAESEGCEDHPSADMAQTRASGVPQRPSAATSPQADGSLGRVADRLQADEERLEAQRGESGGGGGGRIEEPEAGGGGVSYDDSDVAGDGAAAAAGPTSAVPEAHLPYSDEQDERRRLEPPLQPADDVPVAGEDVADGDAEGAEDRGPPELTNRQDPPAFAEDEEATKSAAGAGRDEPATDQRREVCVVNDGSDGEPEPGGGGMSYEDPAPVGASTASKPPPPLPPPPPPPPAPYSEPDELRPESERRPSDSRWSAADVGVEADPGEADEEGRLTEPLEPLEPLGPLERSTSNPPEMEDAEAGAAETGAAGAGGNTEQGEANPEGQEPYPWTDLDRTGAEVEQTAAESPGEVASRVQSEAEQVRDEDDEAGPAPGEEVGVLEDDEYGKSYDDYATEAAGAAATASSAAYTDMEEPLKQHAQDEEAPWRSERGADGDPRYGTATEQSTARSSRGASKSSSSSSGGRRRSGRRSGSSQRSAGAREKASSVAPPPPPRGASAASSTAGQDDAADDEGKPVAADDDDGGERQAPQEPLGREDDGQSEGRGERAESGGRQAKLPLSPKPPASPAASASGSLDMGPPSRQQPPAAAAAAAAAAAESPRASTSPPEEPRLLPPIHTISSPRSALQAPPPAPAPAAPPAPQPHRKQQPKPQTQQHQQSPAAESKPKPKQPSPQPQRKKATKAPPPAAVGGGGGGGGASGEDEVASRPVRLRDVLAASDAPNPESITMQYLRMLRTGALNQRPSTAPERPELTPAPAPGPKSAAGSGTAAAMALSGPAPAAAPTSSAGAQPQPQGQPQGQPSTGRSSGSGSGWTAHGLELARLQARTAWEVSPLGRAGPGSVDNQSVANQSVASSSAGAAAGGRKLPPLDTSGGGAGGSAGSPVSLSPNAGFAAAGGGKSASPARPGYAPSTSSVSSREDGPAAAAAGRVFIPRPTLSAAPYAKLFTPGPGAYSPSVSRTGDRSHVGGPAFGGTSPPRAWAFGSARQRPGNVCVHFPNDSPGPRYLPSKDRLSTSPALKSFRFDHNLPGGRYSLTAGQFSNAPLFNPGPGAYEPATTAAGDPLSPGGSGAQPAYSFAHTRKLMIPSLEGAALPVISKEHAREYFGTLSPGPAHYSPDTSPTRTAAPSYSLTTRPPCWFEPVELSPGPVYKPNELDRKGGHSLGDAPYATIGKGPKFHDPTSALSSSAWLSFNHARRANYGIHSPGPVYLPHDPRGPHVPSPLLATGPKDRFTLRDEPGRLQ